jgi:hypothetical protein
VFVAAVLRPEHREDGELEVVRRPVEQLLDTGELPVRQTERSMEGLLRDRGQEGQCSRGVRCGFCRPVGPCAAYASVRRAAVEALRRQP